MSKLVIPGQYICSSSSTTSGYGTHSRDGNVYASIMGRVVIEGGVASVTKNEQKRPEVVPTVGCTVTCRVVRVHQRSANVEILCVGQSPLQESFRGIIRKENVRQMEVDKVDMYQSFRPGDIVRAFVASMGTAKSYELSTAKNELGVIYAKSEAGDSPMVPISWQQMQCPVTQEVEFRKVAKVLPATST